MDTKEIIAEFRKKFETRDYDTNAHALDINVINLPGDIEAFLVEKLEEQKRKILVELRSRVHQETVHFMDDTTKKENSVYYFDIEETLKQL